MAKLTEKEYKAKFDVMPGNNPDTGNPGQPIKRYQLSVTDRLELLEFESEQFLAFMAKKPEPPAPVPVPAPEPPAPIV